MLKRNLWKLVASLALVVWAATALLPLNDRPFPDYAKSAASAKAAEFSALIKEASDRVATGQAQTVYIALKNIAKDRRIDLGQFFPQFNLGDVKNIERRNALVLDELLRRSKGKLQLGLDLKGGVAFTLEVDEAALAKSGNQDAALKITKAIEIIGNRINAFGVAEPVIRPIGTTRIEVQLPGVNTKDNPEVVDSVKKPARLDFRIVHADIAPSSEMPTDVPPGYEVLSVEDENRQNGQSYLVYYVVKRIPEMSGEHVKSAYPSMDQYGRFEVHLNFDSVGAKQFGDVTGANVGRLLGIVLDGKLYSAPRINDAITGGSAQVTGNFSQREAERLAGALNNPLDLPLQIKEQYEVGPSLAQDAISSAITASVIGAALVAGFMITYYTVGGLIAVATLAINVLIILGVMASLGATMTLPGLAGVVLTMGMAVDANILIFERMRDELNLGKSLKSALVAGYDKAFTTIVDAHLTQLAICAVMIFLGTGPIKGFGVTLAIGVFSTLFSVLVTGHLLTDWLIESEIIKKLPMLKPIKIGAVDFVKYGKPSFIVSWAIVLLGLGVVFMKGDKIYGIDFAGGDVVSVSYTQKLDLKQIRDVAAANKIGEVNPTYVEAIGSGKEVLKIETEYDRSTALITALQKAYPAAGLEKVGGSLIGPAIGKEIEWNALKALAVSMVIILIYVAFRFEFGFGIGAVVASIHDILMTIGVFVLFGKQFSAPMVAAILSIAGYSINDTIVVFDRIREELRINPTMALRDVINLSLQRVFSRSIMTSVTTLLAALALLFFGTGVMQDLAFTFVVGIITGTFSSIFIAAPIFYWWHKGDRKHVEAHQDVKPTYEWTGSSKASE